MRPRVVNPLGGFVKRKLLENRTVLRQAAETARLCANCAANPPRKDLRIASVAAARKYHASAREIVLPKLEYHDPLDRGLGVNIPKP